MGKYRYNRNRNHNRHVRDNDHAVEQEIPVDRQHIRAEPQKPEHMTHQYDRTDLPNPQKPRFTQAREGVRQIRNHRLVRRIQEWNDRRTAPPTVEEIQQMKLRTEKERLKTEAQGYKNQRRGMLFASYNPPVSKVRRGSIRRNGVPYRDTGYHGGMGFGFGSILMDRGGFGARQGSQGRFGVGTLGQGLDHMFGHMGYRGTRRSARTRLRAKPIEYGSNLSKMFGI